MPFFNAAHRRHILRMSRHQRGDARMERSLGFGSTYAVLQLLLKDRWTVPDPVYKYSCTKYQPTLFCATRNRGLSASHEPTKLPPRGCRSPCVPSPLLHRSRPSDTQRNPICYFYWACITWFLSFLQKLCRSEPRFRVNVRKHVENEVIFYMQVVHWKCPINSGRRPNACMMVTELAPSFHPHHFLLSQIAHLITSKNAARILYLTTACAQI